MARFEQQVTIDATVAQVWEVVTNPETWSHWFPEVDAVEGLSAVAAGATFQWVDDGKPGTGEIVELDTDRGLVKVLMRQDNKEVAHTIDLDQTGGFFGIGANDTKVKYTREYDAGGFIAEFVVSGNPIDALDMKKSLRRLKQFCEMRG
jgi:uncharacterized protein YndB with AHSA1/START domain